MQDAAEVLGGERQAAICRELTKKFEEVLRGNLRDLADQIAAQPVKGEIVLLIDRGAEATASEADIKALLQKTLDTMSVKDAAAFVAGETGENKRKIYQMALEVKARES